MTLIICSILIVTWTYDQLSISIQYIHKERRIYTLFRLLWLLFHSMVIGNHKWFHFVWTLKTKQTLMSLENWHVVQKLRKSLIFHPSKINWTNMLRWHVDTKTSSHHFDHGLMSIAPRWFPQHVDRITTVIVSILSLSYMSTRDGLFMMVHPWRCLWQLVLNISQLTFHPWRLIQIAHSDYWKEKYIHIDCLGSHP